MAKGGKAEARRQVALFFLEGDSEEIFYDKILRQHLAGIPKKIKNVKGLYNIHKTILGKCVDFVRKNDNYLIRIYCCIDRESRDNPPELDVAELKNDIKEDPELRNKVLSVDVILATIMLESWFFYDIGGIYRYLKTPKKERNLKKYLPVEKNDWKTLSKLFSRYGKIYLKGEKSENFIDSLDIDLIFSLFRRIGG